MFEIFLTSAQLIDSVLIAENRKSSELNRREYAQVLQIIDECRFVIVDGDIYSTFEFLTSISEYYTYWCSQHLTSSNNTSLANPFCIEVPVVYSNIFCSEFATLLQETEVDVSNNDDWQFFLDRNEVGEEFIRLCNNEVVVFDPYLYYDTTASFSTIQSLVRKFGNCSAKLALTLIGSMEIEVQATRNAAKQRYLITDSMLRDWTSDAAKTFGADVNLSLIKISNNYHDREVVSNLVRLKSGDSFNWNDRLSLQGKKSRGSTIVVMSNVKAERMQMSVRILGKLFDCIERRYKNTSINTTTKTEQELAKVFFESRFYKYWKQYYC